VTPCELVKVKISVISKNFNLEKLPMKKSPRKNGKKKIMTNEIGG